MLHSHNEFFRISESNDETQQEVTCYDGDDSNNIWSFNLYSPPDDDEDDYYGDE
jgi:dolichyl-phosphate-mannose--protein O-mannosyl transferase